MNLRVVALHFTDGIPSLDSRQSIACEDIGGGVTMCESLKRYPGGYLVGYRKKFFFVPDTQVRCAQVVDDEATEEVAPKRARELPSLSAPEPEAHEHPAPPAPRQRTKEEILATAEPGTIVELPGGVFTRVPPRKAPEPEPPPAEPTAKEPAHTMSRRGRAARMVPAPAEAKE